MSRRAHGRSTRFADSTASPLSSWTWHKPGGPEALVAHALERHGRVDVLVNNVGRAPLRVDGFLATSDADFEASLQINFFAALRATRAVVAAMVTQGGGAIVNVVSVNAFFQPDGLTIEYGAAKAALLNVAKALSQELGPDRHPREQRFAGAGPAGSVVRRPWGRGHDRPGQGSGSRSGPRSGDGGIRHRPVHHARGGGDGCRAILASPRTANVNGANYVIDGGLVKTL